MLVGGQSRTGYFLRSRGRGILLVYVLWGWQRPAFSWLPGLMPASILQLAVPGALPYTSPRIKRVIRVTIHGFTFGAFF